jgi:hypothetical protein
MPTRPPTFREPKPKVRKGQQALFTAQEIGTPGKVTKYTQYRDAFAEGVQAVTGAPFAAAAVKGHQDNLVTALGVHARSGDRILGGDELLAWIRHKAEAWARQTDKHGDFPYNSFVAWLNNGQPSRPTGPTAPVRLPETIVDMSQNPELMPRPRRAARFQ